MPPIHRLDAEAAATAREPAHTTMLIVEDRAELRDSLRFLLERYDHEVLLAASAEEGLAVLRARSDIGLLLTDIGLPGLNGWELARQARAMRQGLAVIYMSGHASAEWHAQGVPHSVFLAKPFAMDDLTGWMKALLGTGR
ncbi:response regulator [Dyella sp. 2RAB6]|uniref:response regulator n=1 Tax=Dyella sp. 2RAB6 TaxID=3232992 RepID=UPI003F8DEB9F